jgi:hypothetical protein
MITGLQAFQRTFPSARAWAGDCKPLVARSLVMDELKPAEGKAGAWEITYVSAERSQVRIYTWSALEVGSLHEGVFGAQPDTWRGPAGQQKPFELAAVKVDTSAALQSAVAASSEYLNKPGDKPQITYFLEDTSRYPDPVWRVLWGPSVGAAKYSVLVDATSGKVIQHGL